jgi:hypothetical protein
LSFFVRGVGGSNFSVRVTDATADNRTKLEFPVDGTRISGIAAADPTGRNGTSLAFEVALISNANGNSDVFDVQAETFTLIELTVAAGFGRDVQIRTSSDSVRPIHINSTRSDLSDASQIRGSSFTVFAPRAESVTVSAFRVRAYSFIKNPDYAGNGYYGDEATVAIIAGSVVGALVLVALIVGAIVFFVHRSRLRQVALETPE